MLLLLLVAAALYLVIGDMAEGLLLAGFAILTIAVVFYRHQRSENALAALRKLGAPRRASFVMARNVPFWPASSFREISSCSMKGNAFPLCSPRVLE
jgi:hypothetical protein